MRRSGPLSSPVRTRTPNCPSAAAGRAREHGRLRLTAIFSAMTGKVRSKIGSAVRSVTPDAAPGVALGAAPGVALGAALSVALGTMLTVAIIPAPAVAQDATGGSAVTGAFADLEPGGRAAALGGAAGPLVADPSALHFNPARLVSIETAGVMATYADLFNLDLVHHTGVFVAVPRFERNVSWDGGAVGDEPGRVTTTYGFGIQATQVDLEPESYGEYDLSFALARHGRWDSRYALVFHYLVMRSDLDEIGGSGWAFDLALARNITSSLEASVVLRSLWSSLKWDTGDDETLLARAQFGLGWRPFTGVQVPLEIVYDLERSHLQRFSGGFEWQPVGPALALRAGLRHTDDGETTETLPSAGLGLTWKHVTFDYGMAIGREELGDTHRFSLGYQF